MASSGFAATERVYETFPPLQKSLDSLVQNETYTRFVNLNEFYALLCDCVHPNFGSNLLVLEKHLEHLTRQANGEIKQETYRRFLNITDGTFIQKPQLLIWEMLLIMRNIWVISEQAHNRMVDIRDAVRDRLTESAENRKIFLDQWSIEVQGGREIPPGHL